MAPTLAARKRSWFVIWAAFTAAPVVYGVVGWFVSDSAGASPELATFRLPFAALALVQLAAGAFLLTRAPRMRDDAQGLAAFFGGESLAKPEAFQQGFVLATAWAEACAILGFVLVFLGAPLTEYLPFGAGTLAVMLAIALPVGRGYWSELERTAGGGTAPVA